MADIQLIVERLNQPPFNRELTLVSFDELTATELLQLLNDVFAELDKAHKLDVRNEAPAQASARILAFLQVLKFPIPTSDTEAFTASVLRGRREVIYPILAYVLAKLPQLKKRAYVAKYLMPIEIPPEFMHDETVQELLNQYRELQLEFKETHKMLDKANSSSGNKISPGELKKEITQLEEERRQLVDKIAAMKKKTKDIPGFQSLLEATSSLRKEQEEEGKLAERSHEQRLLLQAAERRYAEVNRKLAETRAAHVEEGTGMSVLESARRQADEGRALVRKVLPASLNARRETLMKLRVMLAQPAKSEADLSVLKRDVAGLEDFVSRLTAEVSAAQRAAGDDKLAMFRQQAALIAKKLAQKEEALEAASRDADNLAREQEARESKLSELSGPKFMKREEFKAYAATLRNKTNTFKQLKQELADLRNETVVLANTESLLKGRAGDLDAFLRSVEEKKGVSGYTAVQSDLEKISALKARIDESKGKALNEISRIVEDIKKAINEKKAKLTPQMQQLRNLRNAYSELEGTYLKEKATYEHVMAGVESEKMVLEKAADAAQNDLVAEETRLAMLQINLEQLQVLTDRANDEARYEKGDGRLLRDFATHAELWNNRLVQLEMLAKELRKKQKDIKENAVANAAQRTKFLDTHKLLAAKINLYRTELLGTPTGNGSALGLGLLGAAADGGGGADVMTLAQ